MIAQARSRSRPFASPLRGAPARCARPPSSAEMMCVRKKPNPAAAE